MVSINLNKSSRFLFVQLLKFTVAARILSYTEVETIDFFTQARQKLWLRALLFCFVFLFVCFGNFQRRMSEPPRGDIAACL